MAGSPARSSVDLIGLSLDGTSPTGWKNLRRISGRYGNGGELYEIPFRFEGADEPTKTFRQHASVVVGTDIDSKIHRLRTEYFYNRGAAAITTQSARNRLAQDARS